MRRIQNHGVLNLVSGSQFEAKALMPGLKQAIPSQTSSESILEDLENGVCSYIVSELSGSGEKKQKTKKHTCQMLK